MRILLLIPFLLITACRSTEDRVTVVTSTSMISSVVHEVAGERIDVVSIVPAGMCPGHFDLKPDDVKRASIADAVLIHGWEEWMGELLRSVGQRSSTVRTIPIRRSWMVPSVHLEAVDWIVATLSSIDPEAGEYFRRNGSQYRQSILENIVSLEEQAKGLEGIPVLANQHQSEFLEWLGFRVAATFASDAGASPGELVALVRRAKDENVRLVVDNLQDEAQVGKLISDELNGIHVVLTNFPLEGSYLDALNDNVKRLLEAVGTMRIEE
ncbi:hypothetical protein AMJ40_00590 [candidate division TA06 bacterium DG_26]|uniref:Zinc ABC transporter substrate-binding protein n=1 Tax=candidate division TA06 bacterium DG_26 TaxID=1703771 RepID=A0A0S7WM28_UNCT6|nr:MAG: hypothetical protein AMJ40_00590 [candidate division TA06 bacterium DG_26]